MAYVNQEKARANSRQRTRRRRERQRRRALSYLGGRCALCGATESLEFDHTNGHKRDNVTRLLTYRWARIVAELTRCQLLCVECHDGVTVARAQTLGDEVPF